MDGSLLKNLNEKSPRRRSLRLRGISAIYQAEDASLCLKPPLKTIEVTNSFVANQIKVEMLPFEQDDGAWKSTDHSVNVTECKYSKHHVKTESNGANMQSIDSMTLKDFKVRCKANKRKVVSSKVDCTSVGGDLETKVKEELDLEEPLINLKLKLSKRKRRKCTKGSSDMPSTTSGFFVFTAADLIELKNSAGSQEKYVVNPDLEMDDSPISSVTEFKRDPIDSGNTEPYYVSPSNKDFHIEIDAHDPSYVSEVAIKLHKGTELDHSFINEVLSIDFQDLESKKPVAISSEYCENSSPELVKRIEGGKLENGEPTSFASTSIHCSTNEVPSDYMEADKCTSLLETREEHSGVSSHEFSCFPASERKAAASDASSLESGSGVTNLCSDVCRSGGNCCVSPEDSIFDSGVTQSSYVDNAQYHEITETNNSPELDMVSEDVRYLAERVNSQLMLIHTHRSDDIDHILQCNELHTSCVVANSAIGVEYHNDLVQESVAGDVVSDGNENQFVPLPSNHLSTGRYDMCSVKHSSTCLSEGNDLSSSVTQMLNEFTDGKTQCSNEFSNPFDAEGLAEELHSHSHVSPPFLYAHGGSHHAADELSKTAEKPPSSAADESLYGTSDKRTLASTEISHSHSFDIMGQDLKKEPKCELSMRVEDPPKKILSNRKTLSPAAQDKLCRALKRDDSYDAITIPGQETMIKRPKNNRNSSSPTVEKGILKSPNSSSSTPCSCMKSSLLQMQPEEVIRFSMRQMHDIKSIAMKLLNGLNNMTSIVEESLCTEACSSAPSKFTSEEVMMAIKQASELGSMTNKWLSIMSKDCNRFCKILGSTDKKADSPVCNVRKGRKKIIFADEAGGLLCHIKVFDRQPPSLVVPEGQKGDTQP